MRGSKAPRTLKAVRPNEGVRSAYQRRLDAAVRAMHRDVLQTVRVTYRENEPELVTDASPAKVLAAALQRLSVKWRKRFAELSPKLAEYFARDAAARSQAALKRILREAGFTVEFKMTRAMNDAYQAVIAENIELIKSIPEQYLKNVQGDVMRSVQVGRDLGTLSTTLQSQYGVTKRRAALIARDQNNKATAVLVHARQREIGITRAVWLHSGGGKTPRPEHVAFSGKSYDVAKGAFLEGKWTWPGVEINCRCVSMAIVPGFD